MKKIIKILRNFKNYFTEERANLTPGHNPDPPPGFKLPPLKSKPRERKYYKMTKDGWGEFLPENCVRPPPPSAPPKPLPKESIIHYVCERCGKNKNINK